MTETNWEGPLSIGNETGVAATDTRGFVKAAKVVSVGAGDGRKIVTLPTNSVVTGLGFIPTSAFTGGDSVTALTVSFGNSADANQLGVVTVSAATRYTEVLGGFVSAANFDSGGTIVVVISAVSTTTFTGGGGRAFIEFVKTG